MGASKITDDPTIGDDEVIWRRIPLEWVVEDKNLNRKRPTSQCFRQDGPVSVYIASEAQSAQAVMQQGKEPFLAALTVGFVRQLGLGIIRDLSSGGPGHALLHGPTNHRRNCQQMAKTATWVKPYAP